MFWIEWLLLNELADDKDSCPEPYIYPVLDIVLANLRGLPDSAESQSDNIFFARRCEHFGLMR